MLIYTIILLIAILAVIILLQRLRKNADKIQIPICNFSVTRPVYENEGSVRTAKYSVYTKNKDRYFRDFPLGFKFYSDQKFRSKIKITYNISGDDEIEVIYDRIVEFDEYTKEHIYYMNDVIVGSIDIEIYTDSQYGIPTILFELLQNNMCHMIKEHKLEIKFPH